MTVGFARDHSVDLAVKGGGHSADTSSSTDGGVLIDLSSMKQVNVNPLSKTVTAQGGALWADVNEAAGQSGLAVVGGTFSHVGVGGLCLRGGYGYLTPQYGLALDNLISVTIVVADGRVLRAARDENPDLFWAVRGAGPSVGVVAELVLQAHAQLHDVWHGIRTYAIEKLPQVIQELNGAMFHPRGRAAAECVFSLSPDTRELVINTVLFFNGSEEEGRRHFAGLLQLECLSNDVKMRPYAEANTLLDPVVPPGGRKKLVGLQLNPPIRPEFASEVMQEVSRQFTTKQDMAQSSVDLEFIDLSRIRLPPTMETAFPARSQAMNGVIILQWEDPNNDNEFLAWADKIQAMCKDESRRTGHQPNSLVSNFLNFTQGMCLSTRKECITER